MRRYGSSKMRIALFVVLIGAILCSVGISLAQQGGAGAGAGAGEVSAGRPGMFSTLMSMILGNMDVVFFTIMLCSVIAVALIVKGFIQTRESVLLPQSTTVAIRNMIANKKWEELLAFTEQDTSFLSRALYPALRRSGTARAMKEAMETAIAEETAEQFRRIEYLNIIGNLGPLLGLLGTVLGMIDAFAALKAAGGSASPSELAGGISVALTHTFLGLMLAVPCLAAFGVLRTMVDRLTIRGALLADDILVSILPEEEGAAGVGARKTIADAATAEV